MAGIEHDRQAKRFSTTIEGYSAELDYELSGTVMTITHTGVPGPVGGRGIAAALMRAAVDEAAERGWTIHPTCSYAVAFLRKHPIGD